MFNRPLRLTKPGLFVTATDTEVGKTVVTCAIASHLRRPDDVQDGSHRGFSSVRVGVCKPLATGCRREREGLVSEYAEALAHFADCREPLDVINPVRYRRPLAPAVAAADCGDPVDLEAIWTSLTRLDAVSDVLLIEGIGGILVPIVDGDPIITVLDLIKVVGFPVVIVVRAGLGTLNHTAMTIQLLRDAGCPVAGLVVNRYEADSGGRLDARQDLAMATNRQWLERITGVRVLATVPQCDPKGVEPHRGRMAEAILEAIGTCYWSRVIGSA